MNHVRRRRHRGQNGQRYGGDDAADDRRHALEVNELPGLVDCDGALTLRVPKVRRELAAGGTARLVDFLKCKLMDLAAAWPKRPAGPVSSTTTPTVCVQGCCADTGSGARAIARVAAETMDVKRTVNTLP